jgi:hypothetical protein
MKYQINADHDEVPEGDKYAKDTQAWVDSVAAGSVTVKW